MKNKSKSTEKVSSNKKISQAELDEKALEITPSYSEDSIFAKINQSKYIVISLMTIFVFITAFWMYKSTFTYPIVYCDDNIFLLDYQEYNADSAAYTKSIDRTFGTSYYRPMLGNSFVYDARRGMARALDSARSKKGSELNEQEIAKAKYEGSTNPEVFHETNVLMHAIGSIFVFGLLINLGYRRINSFIFAMIFALHPLLTPAASWISGRNDSLLAMFVSISFVCLTLFYDKKNWSQWLFLILYTLFYGLALFTKEVGVFFPFVVISYVIFFRREKFFTFKTMATAGATMLVGFTWYYLRNEAIKEIQNPDTIGFEAFFKNYPTLPAMIGKIFLPIKSIALSSFESFTIISGILITILVVYAVVKVNNTSKSRILFGLSWFLLFLIPTLFIRIVFVDDFFDYAEHRAYLPIIGVFIIVIELLKALKVDFTKKGTLAIAMCVIMLFGYKSYTYKRTFDGRKNFWGHMTSIYPDKSRGYLDLGKAFLVNGEYVEAERLYERGIVLNPNNINLYIDLGVLYLQIGKVEESITKSKQALSIKSTDPMANFNLGWAYNEKGMYAESIPFMENALRMMNNPNWWMRLGNSYYNVGQHEKAIQAFNQTLNAQPTNFIAMSNMAVSLSMVNKINEAEQLLIRAIQLQPRYPDAYNNLLTVYMTSNQRQKIAPVLQAMKVQGLNVPDNLAQTLRQMGAM